MSIQESDQARRRLANYIMEKPFKFRSILSEALIIPYP
jgi:hypothetical protein